MSVAGSALSSIFASSSVSTSSIDELAELSEQFRADQERVRIIADNEYVASDPMVIEMTLCVSVPTIYGVKRGYS